MSDVCCKFCEETIEQSCSYKKINNSSIPDCCGSCAMGKELDHTQLVCCLPNMDIKKESSLVGHLYICSEFKRQL